LAYEKQQAVIELPLQNTEDFSDFNYTIYQNEAVTKGFFEDSVAVFIEVLQTWEGFEDLTEKFELWKHQITAIGRRSYTANKPGSGYNVLNHGDFHTRNILMKPNEDNKQSSISFVSLRGTATAKLLKTFNNFRNRSIIS